MEDIKLGRKLGSGNYGTTYLIEGEDQNYALKIIDISRLNDDKKKKTVKDTKAEFKLVKRLNHPNIAKYYDMQYYEKTNKIYI